MERVKGQSIFEGIVIGEPYLRKKKVIKIEDYKIEESQVDSEIDRFSSAIKESMSEIKFLKNESRKKISEDELKILKVHLMMLDDPVFLSEITKGITKGLVNAEKAVHDVVENYIEMFARLKDSFYNQRVLDVKDIGERLLSHLMSKNRDLEELDGKVLLTKEVLPSELLKAHHQGIKIKGLVTEYGGDTSHVAILAKALKIPTLMGAKGIKQMKWSEIVILDTRADNSCIINFPEKELLESYLREKQNFEDLEEEYRRINELPAETLDGVNINLMVNVGGNLDIAEVGKECPAGVGLMRSEFIYMDSEAFPSEEKQMRIYEKVYNEMDGCQEKSLTIRTLDIGADKTLAYYETPKEENPFLGVRGLRLTLSHQSIFRDQLRAILRVAHNKNIKIMYPMVTNIAELNETEKLLEDIKEELRAEGLPFKEDIEVGIMIEVPSTVLLADIFAKRVDFLSIGTNDLTQYILAADRLSSDVGHLYTGYDPAVLRAINMVAEVGIKHNIPVSVCGEMGGAPMAILAFLSFGITNLSMLSAYIPRAKSVIRSVKLKELKGIKEKLLNCATTAEVKKILKNY